MATAKYSAVCLRPHQSFLRWLTAEVAVATAEKAAAATAEWPQHCCRVARVTYSGDSRVSLPWPQQRARLWPPQSSRVLCCCHRRIICCGRSRVFCCGHSRALCDHSRIASFDHSRVFLWGFSRSLVLPQKRIRCGRSRVFTANCPATATAEYSTVATKSECISRPMRWVDQGPRLCGAGCALTGHCVTLLHDLFDFDLCSDMESSI